MNFPANIRTSLALLGLADWIRGQRSLRAIYRFIPQRFRIRVSTAVTKAAMKGAHFPTLPTDLECCVEGKEFPASAPLSPAWQPTSGVNIFGYLRGQFGLAESARVYARALLAAGYPVALCDIDIDIPHGQDDASLAHYIGVDAPYGINLIFVNPDHLEQALNSIGHAKLQGRYNIACWFWELEKIPDNWLWAIDVVDEFLVASTFVQDAIRRETAKPILRVPMPVSLGAHNGTRKDFSIPCEKFLFLTTFDFHSSIRRKNPFAVAAAFRSAFPSSRDDVRLMVKSSNGHQFPEHLRQLLSIGSDDPRIIVRDQVLDRAHILALQRCADAYVSLHRAEGFGLGLAECMAMGKPVIGTGWSGNLDFMTADNSCLVNYKMVPVEPGDYLHVKGARWADADINHAAEFMKRVADEPNFARELGRRAAGDIESELSPKLAAHRLIARLEALVSAAGSDHV